MLKPRISLKLGTIDGCGVILTSTKSKVGILNSLGFTGTPLKTTKSTHFCIINQLNLVWLFNKKKRQLQI